MGHCPVGNGVLESHLPHAVYAGPPVPMEDTYMSSVPASPARGFQGPWRGSPAAGQGGEGEEKQVTDPHHRPPPPWLNADNTQCPCLFSAR